MLPFHSPCLCVFLFWVCFSFFVWVCSVVLVTQRCDRWNKHFVPRPPPPPQDPHPTTPQPLTNIYTYSDTHPRFPPLSSPTHLTAHILPPPSHSFTSCPSSSPSLNPRPKAPLLHKHVTLLLIIVIHMTSKKAQALLLSNSRPASCTLHLHAETTPLLPRPLLSLAWSNPLLIIIILLLLHLPSVPTSPLHFSHISVLFFHIFSFTTAEL